MSVDVDWLRQIRQAAAGPASLDVPMDVDSLLTRADTVADEAALAAVQAVGDTDDLPATVSDALEALTERQREVLRLRYGVGRTEPRSLAEIGQRLGVTRERARQIEGQAMRRLRTNPRLRRALLEHASA
jgi:RNA polymerase sigma factor (sigma-70 family)